MFQRKTPKGQLPDKTPYTAYYPHTTPPDERIWSLTFYRVLSIDPSIKNCAIRVEERPTTGGPITTKLFVRLCLPDIASSDSLCLTYDTLSLYLDQHLDLFLTCHMMIMERQLPINYRAVRISQHILSYFLVKLHNAPLLPVIFEIDPKLKTGQLGAPSGLTDAQTKSWAVEKATELLTIRGDVDAINAIRYERNAKTKKKKPDDLADTVCQIEALFTYLQLPLTTPIQTVKLSLGGVQSGK